MNTETEMFCKINQGIHSTQINTINVININKDQHYKIHNHAQNVVPKDTMQKFVVDGVQEKFEINVIKYVISQKCVEQKIPSLHYQTLTNSKIPNHVKISILQVNHINKYNQ